MKDRANKRFAALLIVVALASFPTSVLHAQQARQTRTACDAADTWGALAAMTAFGLAFIPPLYVISAIYGGIAVGAQVYKVVYCSA